MKIRMSELKRIIRETIREARGPHGGWVADRDLDVSRAEKPMGRIHSDEDSDYGHQRNKTFLDDPYSSQHMDTSVQCMNCDGSGTIDGEECPECFGCGLVGNE